MMSLRITVMVVKGMSDFTLKVKFRIFYVFFLSMLLSLRDD